jgi:hypothetical protein
MVGPTSPRVCGAAAVAGFGEVLVLMFW